MGAEAKCAFGALRFAAAQLPLYSERVNLSRLIDSVGKMSRAIDGAAAQLVCDDLPVIKEQSKRAEESVAKLQQIVSGDGERDEIFVLLHQINNQLTGILSLTLLIKDDLAADHASRPSLDDVDHAARDAADSVKKVAAALRK